MYKRSGFTLIEVLVATFIVAVAFAAMLKSMSGHTRHLQTMEDKTVSMWVALQAIKSAQAGLIPAKEQGNQVWQKTRMLNRDWYWQMHVHHTKNKKIDEITVVVYDKPEHHALFSLKGGVVHHG